MRRSAITMGAILVTACTSVSVQPVPEQAYMMGVCIRENDKVKVEDFLGVLRDGFERHGILTKVYRSDVPPSDCDFLVSYTATRKWDFTDYLAHAEIRIERAGRKVAAAEYHLRAGGGLTLTKFASTKSKIDPVIDALLGGVAISPSQADVRVMQGAGR